MKCRGMVLLTMLLLLTIMLLVVFNNLLISQLSMKTAKAAQYQLQLEYQAYGAHIQQLQAADLSALAGDRQRLASCPGTYAAWSGHILRCELLFLETSLQSQLAPLTSQYHSILLRQSLYFDEEE